MQELHGDSFYMDLKGFSVFVMETEDLGSVKVSIYVFFPIQVMLVKIRE